MKNMKRVGYGREAHFQHTRFLRPVGTDGREFEVWADGQQVGSIRQAASGWWWLLPKRGGNLGQEGNHLNAARRLVEETS